MPLTQTKIYLYKEIVNQEYVKELATVSNSTAADVVDVIKGFKDIPASCLRNMSVHRVMNQDEKMPGINKMYIQDIDFRTKPLCMESAPGDDFFRLLRCHTNLMSGKCKCPAMTKVGEILFPQYYVKCK